MSVKNVSQDLTIEVVGNINQTFCGGQVAGVKYIIFYHIYNNGKYSKEYSVLNTVVILCTTCLNTNLFYVMKRFVSHNRSMQKRM